MARRGLAKRLRVPHRAGAIVLDSDTDDPGWTSALGPARTGPFALADGSAARPYSDARLVWGDGHLYLALYAADQDIESLAVGPDRPVGRGDSFRLLFTREDADEQFSIEVSPSGTATESLHRSGGRVDPSWTSGTHVSREIDGTLNDSTDEDEEWVIEMAIPLDAFGMAGRAGEAIGFAVSRCDTPKDGERVCAGWGDWLGAQPLERGRLVLDR